MNIYHLKKNYLQPLSLEQYHVWLLLYMYCTCIHYTVLQAFFYVISINKASIVCRGIETDMKLDIRQFLISVLLIGSMIINVKKTTNSIPDKKRRKLYMHQIRIHSNCIKSMHHKEILKLKIAS